MLKSKQKFRFKLAAWLFVIGVVALTFNQGARANITASKVTLGSSVASASTTYAFNMTLGTTGTPVKSMTFEICSTAACSASPAGASVSGFTLTAINNFGDNTTGNWTTSTAAGPPIMAKLADAGNAANPTGPETLTLSGITNTNTSNTTFYIRITTYSAAGFSGQLDQGIIATSTAQQESVNATVNSTLTFCVYDQGASCGSPGTGTVNLGTLSTATTGTGTHQMEATTNAQSGYSITYTSPHTLQSGSNTITAIGGSATASSTGNQQFGINLVSDPGTPNIANSANPTGGSGSASSPYATGNSYAFQGDGSAHQVASAAGATNKTTYTVAMIANIDGIVQPGVYNTTLTYVCTANY